jgi:hypothetical protein
MFNAKISDMCQACVGFGDNSDIFSFYQFVIDNAPNNSKLVEVGNYCGKGLMYLALASKLANKGLKVLGSDWGRGPSGDCVFPSADEVLKHAHNFNVIDDVTLLYNKSHLAAEWVPDESLYFVFIDDGHLPHEVEASCAAWYPKVMKGGIFAGHDYQWPGVNDTAKRWYPSHKVWEYENTKNIFYFEKV